MENPYLSFLEMLCNRNLKMCQFPHYLLLTQISPEREISCLNDRIYQDIYISIDSSCSSWHFDSLIWIKNLLYEKLIPHFSQNSNPKTSKIFGVKHFGQYSSWHRQIIVQSIHYVQLVHTLDGKPLSKFPSTWTIHAKSMLSSVNEW